MERTSSKSMEDQEFGANPTSSRAKPFVPATWENLKLVYEIHSTHSERQQRDNSHGLIPELDSIQAEIFCPLTKDQDIT